MEIKNVRISMRESGRGAMEIDGVPLTNVRGFKLEAGIDKATRLTLELVAVNVEYEGPVDVTTVDRSVCSDQHRQTVPLVGKDG